MSLFKWKSRNPHARTQVVYDLACMLFGHKYRNKTCQRCNWSEGVGF